MREISLHIIDIVENSIAAEARLISIEVEENRNKNYLKVIIEDDGKGMSDEKVKNVKDPFVTSRSTRRVGLGISLFEAACLRCDGDLSVQSQLNKGTIVTAFMKLNHIDRAPIGRMDETIVSLLFHSKVEFVYKHKVDDKEFILDTRKLKEAAGEDLTQPDILKWIKEYVAENLKEIEAAIW